MSSNRHGLSKDLFLFKDVVGEGGFGKVSAALFSKTRKWYAVKDVNKYELMKHRTGYDMISSELKALVRVEHAFIAQLHFAFHDKLSCYLVFDLKTGNDLRYYLRNKNRFSEKHVAFYIVCIASALNHIHSRGVIHRDVKPENILLDVQGYPHLTDFGVAYVQEDFDGSKPLLCNLASGTKQYLAPEVFTKCHLHGPQSDYWSLGVVAYELLYSKRPFEKHCPHFLIDYLESVIRNTSMLQDGSNSCDILFTSSSPGTSHASSPCRTTVTSTPSSLANAVSKTASYGSNHKSRNKRLIFPSLNGISDDSFSLLNLDVHMDNHGQGKEEMKEEYASLSNICTDKEDGIEELSCIDDDYYEEIDENLLVPIPTSNKHIYLQCAEKSSISAPCIDLLQHLFDVRPRYRLGYNNCKQLHRHEFFKINGCNWSSINSKTQLPCPGFPTRRKCGDDDQEESHDCGVSGLHNLTKQQTISSDQEALFQSFYYINPSSQSLFPEKEKESFKMTTTITNFLSNTFPSSKTTSHTLSSSFSLSNSNSYSYSRDGNSFGCANSNVDSTSIHSSSTTVLKSAVVRKKEPTASNSDRVHGMKLSFHSLSFKPSQLQHSVNLPKI